MAEFFWQDTVAAHGNTQLLVDNVCTWSGEDIRQELPKLRERLASSRVVAVLADNSADWVVLDLACQDAGIVHLPLPAFFHPEQLRHALEQSGADTLLTDQPERVGALDLNFSITSRWRGLTWMRRVVDPVSLPSGTRKISFTSGSTGAPKGACLSATGLRETAHAVQERLADLPLQNHLAVLPLALLLENVAGVYAPLLRGMTIHLPPLHTIGWAGMQGFDPAALDAKVQECKANSVILVPELLKAWTAFRATYCGRPQENLIFAAVGGARVAPELITNARAFGIPAYQGYGLTEGGSVLSINRPGDDSNGVGRPLKHAQLSLADGELRVSSGNFLGYIGQAARQESEFATGDLATFDNNGHLHLQGRRKHLLITSFGRNISPEWVEAALLAQPQILQTIVTGDGQPSLTAIIVPMPGVPEDTITQAVSRANSTLPDYAQVGRYLISPPFTPANGLATGNGRPRRQNIIEHFSNALLAPNPETRNPYQASEEPAMSFYDHLKFETAADRNHLLSAPIISECLQGRASLNSYLAFLSQAYHHVRHTTPLLMTLGGRLPERLAWMRAGVAEYIEEEIGHEEWILNDIAAAGGDAEAVRNSRPDLPAELMVAYAYDLINRGNPAAFFGMVFVLEGTSVDLALTAADRIQKALALPDSAFSYLRSHGTLDQEHTQHLADLLDRMTPDDQADVLHAAKVFFKLYGDIFHALPVEVVPCN